MIVYQAARYNGNSGGCSLHDFVDDVEAAGSIVFVEVELLLIDALVNWGFDRTTEAGRTDAPRPQSGAPEKTNATLIFGEGAAPEKTFTGVSGEYAGVSCAASGISLAVEPVGFTRAICWGWCTGASMALFTPTAQYCMSTRMVPWLGWRPPASGTRHLYRWRSPASKVANQARLSRPARACSGLRGWPAVGRR